MRIAGYHDVLVRRIDHRTDFSISVWKLRDHRRDAIDLAGQVVLEGAVSNVRDGDLRHTSGRDVVLVMVLPEDFGVRELEVAFVIRGDRGLLVMGLGRLDDAGVALGEVRDVRHGRGAREDADRAGRVRDEHGLVGPALLDGADDDALDDDFRAVFRGDRISNRGRRDGGLAIEDEVDLLLGDFAIISDLEIQFVGADRGRGKGDMDAFRVFRDGDVLIASGDDAFRVVEGVVLRDREVDRGFVVEGDVRLEALEGVGGLILRGDGDLAIAGDRGETPSASVRLGEDDRHEHVDGLAIVLLGPGEILAAARAVMEEGFHAVEVVKGIIRVGILAHAAFGDAVIALHAIELAGDVGRKGDGLDLGSRGGGDGGFGDVMGLPVLVDEGRVAKLELAFVFHRRGGTLVCARDVIAFLPGDAHLLADLDGFGGVFAIDRDGVDTVGHVEPVDVGGSLAVVAVGDDDALEVHLGPGFDGRTEFGDGGRGGEGLARGFFDGRFLNGGFLDGRFLDGGNVLGGRDVAGGDGGFAARRQKGPEGENEEERLCFFHSKLLFVPFL